MTDLLDTLTERENRAHPDPDLDCILDAALARGRRLAARRRAAAAGASAAALVGVGALVAVLVTSTQASSESSPVATAARPGASTGARGVSTNATEGRARLVPAPPAPTIAPVSLGLLPDGWTTSGVSSGYASWSPPGRWYRKYVEPLTGKLVVSVASSDGEHLRTSDFPLRVAGRPTRYTQDGDGQHLSLYVNPSITVEFELPSTTRLTKQQALTLAGSLTIRNISNPTHG